MDMSKMQVTSISVSNIEQTTDAYVPIPDFCPCGNHPTEPKHLFTLHTDFIDKTNFYSLFYCHKCNECFMTVNTSKVKDGCRYYLVEMTDILPNTKQTTTFSNTISMLSPRFIEIYNQAELAEQQHLDEICGLGYRKAFEVLIKDYIISLYPDKADEVCKKFLGNCIKDYLSDEDAKALAKASAYIGNSEAHYVKNFQDGIESLKSFICSFVSYIEFKSSSDIAKDFLRINSPIKP